MAPLLAAFTPPKSVTDDFKVSNFVWSRTSEQITSPRSGRLALLTSIVVVVGDFMFIFRKMFIYLFSNAKERELLNVWYQNYGKLLYFIAPKILVPLINEE